MKTGGDLVTSVMWFRRDLRIEDNRALKHALEESESLVLLFHANPEQFIGGGSKNEAAFFKSVDAFRKELAEEGATLQILYGDLETSFRKLKEELPDWTDIYINRDETGYGLERDWKIVEVFKELNVKPHGYHDHYLHSAEEIKTNTGTAYKVYTPYYNKWIQLPKPTIEEVNFDVEKVVNTRLFVEDIVQFNELLASQPNILEFETGSLVAKKSLNEFIANELHEYDEARDIPFKDGTSRLSHHLRTGEISIRTVYNQVNEAKDSKGKETFIKELAWRDFYNMVYVANPEQKDKAIKPEFDFISWENSETAFKAWKEGKTGYPIVDAAMRQLKETGWMHNRSRMIVASFLMKDLLIDWRWGERYFQEQLVDYDGASNIGGWQWAASTGTDSAPYFRIFNPTTQSERFDADGAYIKKYVPELRNVPNKKIHDPSSLTADEQDRFGVIIGADYPWAIVSHKEQRKLAIGAYEASKEIHEEMEKK